MDGVVASHVEQDRVVRKSILIVEDNPLNLRLVEDLLKHQGFATVHSIDGLDVLELTRQHRPALILMDIQLPQVSGLEIIRLIKGDADLRAIPIMAMTAFAMKGDEEKIRESGCDHYMSKPISIAEFTSTVRHLLG
jgi:two-component system, cell cycle response regulator DivK